MSDVLWEHDSRNLVEKRRVVHWQSAEQATVIFTFSALLGGQVKVTRISNTGDSVSTHFYSIREARAVLEAYDDWIGGGPGRED